MGTLKVLLVAFFVALSVAVAFSDEAREETSKLPLEESDQESSIEERSKELKSKDEAASKLEIKTNKWIPVALKKWVVLKANTEPYIQLVSSKSVELYKTAKIATAPPITKFQEVTAPQVQKVKKISKPYIDHAADLIKKVHTEPYIQMVSSKPVELYKTAKIATVPHITKFQEVTAPHIQKVKKISKPYIDQAADLIKKVHTEPYIQLVSSKSVELYKTAKIALKKKPDALEVQSIVFEDKSRELSAQLESFKRTNEELKERIQKTERALKAAEEELMRAQLKGSAKLKHLHEVHGAWLPPWLATQMARYMAVMSAKWNEHVKPVMDSLAVCYVIHVFAETFLVARLRREIAR